MKRIVQVIDQINMSVGIIASWTAVPLTIVVLIEVILRYFFNNPTIWAFDASWMLHSVFFLLGGGLTMVRKRHVRIDLIFGALPRRVQIVYELVFFAVVLVPIMLVLGIRSTEYALHAWRTGQTISSAIWVFPAAPIRTVIPVAFFLLVVQGIGEILRNLSLLIDPQESEEPDE
jgi:TRAP-type mannitol/chloroaromatic compound transport system permease small subunit